jgi:hypothetical protein
MDPHFFNSPPRLSGVVPHDKYRMTNGNIY